MNPTHKRLKSLLKPSRHEIKAVILLLYLSGWGGAWKWPPPGREVYETLITLTGLDGPEGSALRMVMASLMVVGWLVPSTIARCLLYVPGILSCAMIAFAFWDIGQGFWGFGWGALFLCGLRAVDAERSAYVDEIDATRVEAAAARGLERAGTHAKLACGDHAHA